MSFSHTKHLKYIFGTILVLFLMLITRHAYADTSVETPAIPPIKGAVELQMSEFRLTPKKLELDGEEGIWHPKVQMLAILERLEQYEALNEVLQVQQLLIQQQEHRIQSGEATINVALSLIEAERARGDAYKALAEAKAEDSGTSPWLIAGVCVLAGIAASVSMYLVLPAQ